MAKQTHKVIASVGEYKDRQTGETKKQWRELGRAIDYGDGTVAIKLDLIPSTPDWSGWIKLVPLDEDQQPRQQYSQQSQAAPPPQQRQAPPPQLQAAPQSMSDAQAEEDEIPF